jgi:predicted molibdopterin-dependent oxidoreductase YjgC
MATRPVVASGEPLSITVTPETRVELNDQKASMADLQAGDEVVVQSKAPKGATSFTARMISAERAEQPTEPTESIPADNIEPAA